MYKQLQNYGQVSCNENLSFHTTIHIGGPADFWVQPFNIESLSELIQFSVKKSIPYRVIGSGSNILCSDKGFRGMVISLKCRTFNAIEINKNVVKAGAGVLLSRLIRICQKKGLSGLESLYGIPGTIGGAVVGNSGAFGGSISDCILSAGVIGNEGVNEISNPSFSYRNSNLRQAVIVYACFKLKQGDSSEIKETIVMVKNQRLRTQPIKEKSAGSVFKNPAEKCAGRLLDLSGMKGLSQGGAMFSEKHANFIINRCDAKAQDVIKLIEMGKTRVRQRFGIDLETEIQMW